MDNKKNKTHNIPGTDNYYIPDCPVILPKENLKYFQTLQNACKLTPFSTQEFGNQYISPNQVQNKK